MELENNPINYRETEIANKRVLKKYVFFAFIFIIFIASAILTLVYFVKPESVIINKALLPMKINNPSCATNSSTDKVYCFGGRSNIDSSYYDKIIEFDPKEDTVTIKNTRLPSAIYAHSCAENSATHKIYCFGGYNPYNPAFYSQTIFEYDPQDDKVIIKNAFLPKGTGGLSCVEDRANHKIYCFGGFRGESLPNSSETVGPYGKGIQQSSFVMSQDILEYDPTADTIATKNSLMPKNAAELSCAYSSATSNIYCFGGLQADNPLDQIFEYNPITDTVRLNTAKLPTARATLSCTEHPMNEKIYCLGGQQGIKIDASITTLKELLEYEPITNTLSTRLLTLPSAMAGFSCVGVLSTDKIYCFGGMTAKKSPGTELDLTETDLIFEYYRGSDLYQDYKIIRYLRDRYDSIFANRSANKIPMATNESGNETPKSSQKPFSSVEEAINSFCTNSNEIKMVPPPLSEQFLTGKDFINEINKRAENFDMDWFGQQLNSERNLSFALYLYQKPNGITEETKRQIKNAAKKDFFVFSAAVAQGWDKSFFTVNPITIDGKEYEMSLPVQYALALTGDVQFSEKTFEILELNFIILKKEVDSVMTRARRDFTNKLTASVKDQDMLHNNLLSSSPSDPFLGYYLASLVFDEDGYDTKLYKEALFCAANQYNNEMAAYFISKIYTTDEKEISEAPSPNIMIDIAKQTDRSYGKEDGLYYGILAKALDQNRFVFTDDPLNYQLGWNIQANLDTLNNTGAGPSLEKAKKAEQDAWIELRKRFAINNIQIRNTEFKKLIEKLNNL